MRTPTAIPTLIAVLGSIGVLRRLMNEFFRASSARG
jgi:hypothetical protein